MANIYPKQLAPVTRVYLCGNSPSCFDTWGQVIQNANSALQSSLAALNTNGVKVIYYDSFGFLTNLYNNATAHGFYMPLTNFCDGTLLSPSPIHLSPGHYLSCYFDPSLLIFSGDESDPNQVWDHCWNSTTYKLDADGMFWTNYVQPTTQVMKLVGRDMKRTLDAAMCN